MEHTRKAREEILKSVSNLSDQLLNKVEEEGKWSIVQVLEHLFLFEENAVHGIQETLLKDEPHLTESKPLHLVADRTEKRDAPEYLIPSNEYQTLESLKSRLEESRRALISSIQYISEEDLNQKAFSHRRFGLLSIKQWVDLIGYHEQRHLQQIEEIKASLVK